MLKVKRFVRNLLESVLIASVGTWLFGSVLHLYTPSAFGTLFCAGMIMLVRWVDSE